MNLQYLILLFIIIFTTGTVNAVEIYNQHGKKVDFFGKINGTYYISNDNDQDGNKSFASFGFKGEAQISNRLIGFGAWEHIMEHKGLKNHCTSLSFAGLKFGNIGSIDYGRNYGVLYDITAWTDIMPELGNSITVNNNFISGRANSVFTYRNTNFFGIVNGLKFALQYQGKNNNLQNKNLALLKESHGNGYGMSISYDVTNNISVGAAYSNSNRTIGQRMLHIGSFMENKNKKAAAYSLGIKYNINHLYFAALYSENHHMTPIGKFSKNYINNNYFGFAKKINNFELAARYQFDIGLCPSLSYLQSKINNNCDRKQQNFKKYIELGTSYQLNKNMLAFFDYRINLLNKNSFTKKAYISTNNVIALGLTYIF